MRGNIIPLIARCYEGQNKYGVEFGGQFLCRYFQEKYCIEQIVDMKSKDFNNFYDGLENIKNNTLEIIKNKNIPLILGGDHSVSYGSIKASLEYYNNLHVIWIDSHTDINTEASSETKNKHGMVVSSLMNFNNEDWKMNEENVLQPHQLTFLGANSIDPFEEKVIKEKNINIIYRDSFYNTGIHDLIPDDVPIHISLDVDILDKQFVPCTGTPVDRGYTPELINMLVHHFKGQIVSMDIVEYNPFLGSIDENQISMYSIEKSVESFLKYKIDLK